MKLFIIGNGFDLEHKLPTSFPQNFRRIAERNETIRNFWEFYQSEYSNIWSDFEYSLGKPDFNSLEELLLQFRSDPNSEHESDRDAIIRVSEMSANLKKTLYDFANEAELSLDSTKSLEKYNTIFNSEDIFVTFNYTHTLEKLYLISKEKILHIHGENGKNNLELGYPKGCYNPDKYLFDYRQKGRGPYREIDFSDYVQLMYKEGIFDYYIYSAFETLLNKTKTFYKESNLIKLIEFLGDKNIDKIIVLGHSCKIDFEYFEFINKKYPSAYWEFYPFNEDDFVNIKELVKDFGIKKYIIN